jgi:GntR family transcriptional repressor for pyruvate dehydrogenase complex
MVMDRAKGGVAIEIKQQKRPDLVAEEIKRLITEKDLKPGDRLPREVELQRCFR